jgi:hypothetical protein
MIANMIACAFLCDANVVHMIEGGVKPWAEIVPLTRSRSDTVPTAYNVIIITAYNV